MRSKWFLQMFYTWFGNRYYSKREREYSFLCQPQRGSSRVGSAASALCQWGGPVGTTSLWAPRRCGHLTAPGRQWCLPQNVQPEVPIRHPRAGGVTPPPQQRHWYAEPRFPQPCRFPSQNRSQGMGSMPGPAREKTWSNRLHLKGREHIPADSSHSTTPHKCPMSHTPRGLIRFTAVRATKELMQYFICFLCRSIYYLFWLCNMMQSFLNDTIVFYYIPLFREILGSFFAWMILARCISILTQIAL